MKFAMEKVIEFYCIFTIYRQNTVVIYLLKILKTNLIIKQFIDFE